MLYFKTGVMGSTKTLNLISVDYNYREKGFKTIVYKPSIDIRENDSERVISRTGASTNAVPFDEKFNFDNVIISLPDVIIVDEAQFLTVKQVEQLYTLSTFIPVICYGLKTDFKTEMFPGSKRLIELCDSIEEFKSVCRCGNKAKFNARLDSNGYVITSGEQIGIEGEYKYEALCRFCYEQLMIENFKEEEEC